jgi:hypothetical protein
MDPLVARPKEPIRIREELLEAAAPVHVVVEVFP